MNKIMYSRQITALYKYIPYNTQFYNYSKMNLLYYSHFHIDIDLAFDRGIFIIKNKQEHKHNHRVNYAFCHHNYCT